MSVEHNDTLELGDTKETTLGPIREWKPVFDNLPKHPSIAYFGKRRTGKSTTLMNLAYHTMQDIPFGEY